MSTTRFEIQMIDKRRALDHLLALLGTEGLSGREGKVAAEVRKRLGSAGCKSSWTRGRWFQVEKITGLKKAWLLSRPI